MQQSNAAQPHGRKEEPVCSTRESNSKDGNRHDPETDINSIEGVVKHQKAATEFNFGGSRAKKRTRRSRRKRGVGGGADEHHQETTRGNLPTQPPAGYTTDPSNQPIQQSMPYTQKVGVPNPGDISGRKVRKEYTGYSGGQGLRLMRFLDRFPVARIGELQSKRNQFITISDQTTGPWEYMARIPSRAMPYALVPHHLQTPFRSP